MTMHEALNRIGYEMLERRVQAAEGFTRNALAMTPFANETAAEFASRIRFWAERNHPELIVRLEDHQRQEILPLAETCGCDPNSDGYDDDHCESGDDLEDLCARQHLGFVCSSCVNEDGDGPTWRPDRYEWPCPTVARLDGVQRTETHRG
ncbi:hypothetical protein ACFYWD_21235 [Streptomyces sp. NPDC003781]|uniref:hypothetical protein n=1 Tax=Streptomyces sp. NPDC003781 TaxID=3364686 RepID=UPI00368E290F